MRVREIEEKERDPYDAFVAGQPTGHVFQSYEWGEIKAVSGWRPKRFVIEEEGEITGAFQVLERKIPRLNKRVLYVPCGPALDLNDRGIVEVFADFIRQLAKADRGVFVKIDPPVKDEEEQAKANLIAEGFVPSGDGGSFEGIQPRCVMHLDITDGLEAVLARMDRKWRYNIRLAARKGVGVRAGSRDDLAVFYKILKITGRRDGFLIRNYDYFEHLYDELVPRGMARLFVAQYDGEIICGTLAMMFGDKCWYVYGASGDEHRNLMPNHALQWAMIQWAKENGCPIYDFRGVPCDLSPSHPLHGLVRFKRGFGAHPVKYIGEYELRISRFYSWVHRRAMPLYTKARKMVRK